VSTNRYCQEPLERPQYRARAPTTGAGPRRSTRADGPQPCPPVIEPNTRPNGASTSLYYRLWSGPRRLAPPPVLKSRLSEARTGRPSAVEPAAPVRHPFADGPPPVAKPTLSSSVPPDGKAQPRSPALSYRCFVQRWNLSESSGESRLEQPVAVAIAAVVLVMIWLGLHLLLTNRQNEVVLTTSPRPARSRR